MPEDRTCQASSRLRSDELKDELHAANDRVAMLRKKLYAAQCDEAGVHVGDVVKATIGYGVNRRDGVEAIVRRIVFWSFGGETIYVSPRTKKGAWSKNAQYAHSVVPL